MYSKHDELLVYATVGEYHAGGWMVSVGGANGAVLFLIETPGNDGTK